MPAVCLEVLLQTKPLPAAPGGGRVETRFVSSHGATERVMHHTKVYKALSKDELGLFLAWLRKQPKPIGSVWMYTLVILLCIVNLSHILQPLCFVTYVSSAQ
jgi:hypothetical protein